MKWTPKKLQDFEKQIADLYSKALIKAPIHLNASKDGSLERNLIKIFKKYKITKRDWICSTHRNHLHWLLSGRNPKKLKQQILDGHSMHVFDKNFITSAIVGGGISIAVGIAWALKMKKSKKRVFVFLGDMSALCGIANEAIRFACSHKLNIKFIIENNSKSVNTNTLNSWGCDKCNNKCDLFNEHKDCVIKFDYSRFYGHAGSCEDGKNKHVLF